MSTPTRAVLCLWLNLALVTCTKWRKFEYNCSFDNEDFCYRIECSIFQWWGIPTENLLKGPTGVGGAPTDERGIRPSHHHVKYFVCSWLNHISVDEHHLLIFGCRLTELMIAMSDTTNAAHAAQYRSSWHSSCHVVELKCNRLVLDLKVIQLFPAPARDCSASRYCSISRVESS